MNGVCDGHGCAPIRSPSREPTARAQLVESLHLQPLWILWPSCPHPPSWLLPINPWDVGGTNAGSFLWDTRVLQQGIVAQGLPVSLVEIFLACPAAWDPSSTVFLPSVPLSQVSESWRSEASARLLSLSPHLSFTGISPNVSLAHLILSLCLLLSRRTHMDRVPVFSYTCEGFSEP